MDPDKIEGPCVCCMLNQVLPKTIVRNKKRKRMALFKVTEDAGAKVPRCPQSFEDRDCTEHEPMTLKWTVVDETDTATSTSSCPRRSDRPLSWP